MLYIEKFRNSEILQKKLEKEIKQLIYTFCRHRKVDDVTYTGMMHLFFYCFFFFVLLCFFFFTLNSHIYYFSGFFFVLLKLFLIFFCWFLDFSRGK